MGRSLSHDLRDCRIVTLSYGDGRRHRRASTRRKIQHTPTKEKTVGIGRTPDRRLARQRIQIFPWAACFRLEAYRRRKRAVSQD